jgi:4a-hydroxytetrahydrobiopterin dehydratase
MDRISNQQILDARLADWRKLAQGLHARFLIPDFTVAAAFLTGVAEAAEAANHHPDVKLTYGVVDVALSTHEEGRWVTTADVEMARTISALAAKAGLRPDPGSVTQLELALDTAHEQLAGPFWAALFTGSPDNKVYDTVFDPTDRVPSLWFQGTEEHETPRQRWHFDLWLAPETAAMRIAAALAAGGTLVDDSEAPMFVVLADPEGNKVCVCTAEGRD